MPEVIYPTPDENGKSRTWQDVFPIWKQNVELYEWRIINSIIESIAMNNRMGGATPEELKARIAKGIREQVEEELAKTLAALQALPNPENTGWGAKKEDITEEHDKVLKTRNAYWADYGRWMWYLDTIFENLGGAYREWK